MALGSPNDPPPGWRAFGGLLEPDRTVGGYVARHQEVRGRCHTQHCKRTCEIDMRLLAMRGFERMPIDKLQHLMRCNDLEGCSLQFHEERSGGLPIRLLLGRPHVSIRFKCEACGFFRTALPDQILTKLAATAGPAREVSTVEKLAGITTEPCKACKKKRWRVDVLWPNTNTVGWRPAHRDY